MKILVTGSTGYLGRHLCRRLSGEGHEVVGVHSRNGDLLQSNGLDAFAGTPYDRIYHLATWTQAGDFCLYHPGEQWIHNQLINAHVLAWWSERQPQAQLVTPLTSCSYDPTGGHSEEEFLMGSPTESLYGYGMAKRMLLVGLRAIRQQFGLSYLALVPSTLYGPDYPVDGRQMHFIFDLVRKIVDGKRSGTPVVLWGDGLQRRELIHMDDFITAALRLSNETQNDLVNVGSGEGYSIREFARMICDIVGYDEQAIQYDSTRYVGAREKVLDVRKLHRLLPDFRLRPLKEGLTELVEWWASSIR